MKRVFQSTIMIVALGILLPGCRSSVQPPPIAETPSPTGTPLQPARTPEAATAATEPEPTFLPGPNAVPRDTRIVVNIPAFRMDVFENGAPIKSYQIGIGYPQFPLPTGLRKAQLIIFNPTWTPPDSPWVDSMNVTPGEVIAAGSRQNPLGPIKIPIGMPSLIHGGKPLAKIGTFASHGCVGMTNAQVEDFARLLVRTSAIDLSDETISVYLNKHTKTRVVNLNKLIPVELRYETIVLEDGQLHIYRDVYNQNTNTEENLRAVLDTNRVSFDNFSEEDKTQALEALNEMSNRPRKETKAKVVKASASPSPTASTSQTPSADSTSADAPKKATTRNQKEIVVEITALQGKGYTAPLTLNTGGVSPNKN